MRFPKPTMNAIWIFSTAASSFAGLLCARADSDHWRKELDECYILHQEELKGKDKYNFVIPNYDLKTCLTNAIGKHETAIQKPLEETLIDLGFVCDNTGNDHRCTRTVRSDVNGFLGFSSFSNIYRIDLVISSTSIKNISLAHDNISQNNTVAHSVSPDSKPP